jgi:hypothetical protein
MRFLLLSALLVLVACETRTLNTSQPFFIDIIGTDEAYCIISSPHYRYAVNAPGKTVIERSEDDLKVDCRDNAIQRRRTVIVQPQWEKGELYYRYPETVTVDFSSLDNGSRYNGYRAPVTQNKPETVSSPVKTVPFSQTIDSVLTEDSYSEPVKLQNDTMVEKKYTMGRRSYPIPLTQENSLRGKYELTPQLSSETVVLEHDPSITTRPMQ